MVVDQMKIIKSLIEKKSYMDVISILQETNDIQITKDEKHYFLSLCYYMSGIKNKSHYHIKKSLEFNPRNFKSLVLLTDIYYEDDEIDKAKDNIEKVLKLDSQNKTVLLQQAKVDFYEGEINKSEELIRKLLEEDYNSFDMKYLLVEILIKKKSPLDEILLLIKELKKINKTDELDYKTFQANYIYDNYKECERIYRLMYRKNPNSKWVLQANELLKDSRKIKAKSNSKIIPISDSESSRETERAVSLETALKKLDRFIGLDNVKTEVIKIVELVKYNKLREETLELSNTEKPSYHFLFYGNPGTGKTTIARILGDIFHAVGILEKPDVTEVDRSGLVGQHIGETAVKTQKVIESAMGGILFVDEAYALSKDAGTTNDFGAEAVDTLLKAMEDYRDNLIVIFAGYEEEMKKFVNINPGLESRINKKIKFSDYSDEELIEIAHTFSNKNYYQLTTDAEIAFLQRMSEEQVKINFSNARAVRNIIEEAIQNRAYRLSKIDISKEDLEILEAEDFGIDITKLFSDDFDELMIELQSLEGLNAVKNQLKSIVNTVRANERRKKEGVNNAGLSLHMMFLGNPGTGKTMIARLVSRLLKSIGVLKRGHLVEVGREDLVAQYVGQTAPKTLEKIREAYGGVLFIDEAYTLASSSEQDFGREAIGTLIKEMEDNRDRLVVIMAGYTSEMGNLLTLNSGLKSRIAYEVEFPDYTSEELANIFKFYVEKSHFKLDDNVLDKMERKFHQLSISSSKDFGNARLARQLFEKVIMIQSNRIVNDDNLDSLLITTEDIDNI